MFAPFFLSLETLCPQGIGYGFEFCCHPRTTVSPVIEPMAGRNGRGRGPPRATGRPEGPEHGEDGAERTLEGQSPDPDEAVCQQCSKGVMGV